MGVTGLCRRTRGNVVISPSKKRAECRYGRRSETELGRIPTSKERHKMNRWHSGQTLYNQNRYMRSQTTTILSGRWPGGLEQGFYGREVEDAQGKTRKPLLVSKTPPRLIARNGM